MRVSIACFLFLFVMHDISALLVGSDIAVSLESLINFPEIIIINPNEIASFAWMKNGFTLEDAATDLLFRSSFPVSGTVDFNGGTVTLGSDMIFQNVTTLNGLGVVIGDGYQIHFSSSISSFPSDTESFENTHLSFDGNMSLDVDILFSGECAMDGGGKILTLGNSGGIFVGSNTTLHLKNIIISGIIDENIRCQDDSGQIVLENVRWILDGSTTFTVGAFYMKSQVEMLGTGTFFYESAMTSTIEASATWKLTDDLTLKMGRYPETLSDPIYFEDQTSVLTLDNTDFVASTSGIQITRGSIFFERTVGIDAVNTGTERGMIIGNGNAAEDLHVRLAPGCSLQHNSGYWTYNNGEPDRFDSSTHSAALVRNEGSKIAVHTDLTFPRQTIEIASTLVDPVEISDGVSLNYNETRIVLPTVEFELTGNQLSSFAYLLPGDGNIFFTKGSLPLALYLSGQDNVIQGNASLQGPIVLSDSSTQVTIDINEEVRNSVTLNNGTLSLGSNLTLDGSGVINGPGRVNLCTHTINLSPLVSQWTTSVYWSAEEDGITLTAELDLSDTWTFAGEMLLDGDDNILRLVNGGAFFLEPNAHLIMKDILIEGVSEDSIILADDSCQITLFNSHLILENDTTFTLGVFNFERNNIISGPYTLTFDQVATNTIKAYSELMFDSGITFSAGRSSENREPLYFEDETAILHFNNAGLGVKDTGMTLSRGVVIFDKQCTFDFNSTSTANGLQLGTGVSIDDVTLEINPAASITLNPGHMLQNVTDIEKAFVGFSTSSKLIASTGLVTHYKQDGKLANMTLVINPPTTTSFDPGVNVSFENTIVSASFGDSMITGRRFSPTVLILEGSPDGANILNGAYPFPLLISGTGNLFEGAGIVTGPIIYLSPTADLEWRNIGTLNAVITLSGGTLILGADLSIVTGGGILGPGTIDLNGKKAFYGINDIVQDTALTFMGNGNIQFNSNAELQSSILFQDKTIIEGFGNILDITTGELVVDSGAELVLKNIVMNDLSDSKIRCLDDTSVLTFDNVQLILHDTFTFTHGAMRFKNKNTMSTDLEALFVYESQMTSSILEDSILKMDLGITFSYAPPSIEGNNRLLEFYDNSSMLIMNGASFITTSSGIELTKGTMDVKQNSTIGSTQDLSVGMERGVAFGDGIDDFNIIIRPDIALTINSGFLEYRNINSGSLTMKSPLSSITVGTGATLQLYENLPTGVGRVIFKDNARLLRTTTSNIIGTIEPQGSLSRGRFAP